MFWTFNQFFDLSFSLSFFAIFPSLLFRQSFQPYLFFTPSPFLRIIELNGGQSPLTYKRFQTLISRMEPVEMPAEVITADVMGSCTTPILDDHDDKFGVPSLEELGKHCLRVPYCLPPSSPLSNVNAGIFWVQADSIVYESAAI